MSQQNRDDALDTLGPILSSYTHEECGTVTDVSDDLVEKFVCDPWRFPMHETICAECGSVSTKEITVEGGGTLWDELTRMRKETATSFKLMRFLVIPGVFAFAGTLVGVVIGVIAEELALVPVATLVGLGVGAMISKHICIALRRAGMLW